MIKINIFWEGYIYSEKRLNAIEKKLEIKEEIIKSKDANIELITEQKDFYQGLASPVIIEYFEKTKKSYESIIITMQEEQDYLKQTIQKLKTGNYDISTIKDLSEKEKILENHIEEAKSAVIMIENNINTAKKKVSISED